MAEFRSSAREGSFSDNQFVVPDEVGKLQNQADRRRRGMSRAQAELQRQNALFLQAQQQAQNVENQSRNDIYGAQKASDDAFIKSSAFRYQKELEQERNKNKFRVDTLGLLVNFSKTAASAIQTINKIDQENMLRATNEVQFKQGFSYEDIKYAQEIKDTINDSETQRTAILQKYQAEGKSPEFINAVYEHLVKGGGYANYIQNSEILSDVGRQHASELDLIANDDRLSPDQKRLTLDTRQAELRASLEIDGRIPDSKILEQAYNPYIRDALRQAERVVNKQSSDLLNEQTELDRKRNFINASRENGKFSPGNALDQAKNAPRAGIVNEITEVLLNEAKTVDELIAIKKEQFVGPDGKATSLESGGYSEALSMVNAKIKERQNLDRQLFNDVQQAKELQAHSNVLQEAQGKPLTKKMVEGFSDYLDRELGLTRDRSFDEALMRETVEADAVNALNERFEQEYENGTLSMANLKKAGSPTAILNTWSSRAQAYDNARTKMRDDGVVQTLKTRITGALKENKDLINAQGDLMGDQAAWFVETTAKKYALEYQKALAAGVGDFNAIAAAAIEETKNVDVKGGRIIAYDQAMEEGNDDYLMTLTRIEHINQLQLDGRLTPWKLLDVIGESGLVEASQQLQQTGQSTILDAMAGRFDMTPYELQNKLADVSELDNLEPIEPPKTYQELVNSFTASEKHDFTSDLTRMEAKMRVLTPRMQQTFPVRSTIQTRTFGDRSLSSFAPQVSSIVMEDDSGEPGMDIFFEDKQFPAVLPGVVKDKSTPERARGGYGNYVVIESIDPSTNEKVDVLYSHLENPSQLEIGSSVIPGMIIGQQGGTGSVRSADGTIASIDFLEPAPTGSTSMVPYKHFKQLREQIASQLSQ